MKYHSMGIQQSNRKSNMNNILDDHQYEVYSTNIFNIHRSQSTFYCSHVNKSKINENINLN